MALRSVSVAIGRPLGVVDESRVLSEMTFLQRDMIEISNYLLRRLLFLPDFYDSSSIWL